jgi:bifunctional enzyme CysN/CysC
MSVALAEAFTPLDAEAQHLLQQPAGVLRFLTCGSVDDGKSTLIGRLLHDTKVIQEDQLAQLRHDTRSFGTTGEDLDLALLVDGLEAEREQGITIDVAYRFFATGRRRFIVADTPGHEQYTRNMATGASTADAAVMLVDARHGVLTQTRRHSFIASLMGIRHVVLAVNKMDLAGFDQARFDAIRAEYETAVAGLGFHTVVAVPISARHGDNVAERSPRMPWYAGPSLLGYLENLDVEGEALARPFRMAVQWVNRPDSSFRGYAGTIAAGRVRPGDLVAVAGGKRTSLVRRVVTMDGDLDGAGAGEAVTLVLADELDISRGDVLAAAEAPVPTTDRLKANMVWLSDAPLVLGRGYLVKLGSGRTVGGAVAGIRYRLDVNTRERIPADSLVLNDVAEVEVALDAPVAYEPYRDSRDLGGFIVIDRLSFATVGVGMVETALGGANNLTWQHLDVDKAARAALKGQAPAVVWFTGLSGAGKSTVANLVERKLFAMGRHTYVLDGDNVRHGLNRDLGFGETDRVENIRRVSEVAALFADAGLIVLVSFISPYRAERDAARERVGPGEFVEVFVDTPLGECRRRDPKGLYKKADAGLIRDFTGIDAPYEPPLRPEIHLRTEGTDPAELADRVVEALRYRGILS